MKGLPHSLANAPKPTPTTRGFGSFQLTFTPQLSAAPTQADFNALLTKLIAAGLMAAS